MPMCECCECFKIKSFILKEIRSGANQSQIVASGIHGEVGCRNMRMAGMILQVKEALSLFMGNYETLKQ